jgi:hypothetical protein
VSESTAPAPRAPTPSLAAPPAAPAPAGYHALGPWSRRIVRALAEVVQPLGEGAPALPLDEYARFVDSFVPHLPRLLALAFPVGLLLLELGAFVLGPSLVPFSAMPLPRRRRYVDGWVHARWRLRRDLIKAVKGLCLLAYYSDPRVGARLGYAVDAHVAHVSTERLRRHARDL